MIVPRKESNIEANFLILNPMELLDTKVKIKLPKLMIKHMQTDLIKDAKIHALPYKFWLALVFKDYYVYVQVWSFQTTKDVIGIVNHMDLPFSVRCVDTYLQ